MLTIDNNPITVGIETLSEGSFSSLQFLWVEQFITDYLTSDNVSWLLKLESGYLQRICTLLLTR